MNQQNQVASDREAQETVVYTGSEKTEPLWTVEDVARYLRLEPETVRVMSRDGKIPGIKVGRVWRYRREAIRSWLQDIPEA